VADRRVDDPDDEHDSEPGTDQRFPSSHGEKSTKPKIGVVRLVSVALARSAR
jgi:hypothetical protein